MDTIVVFDPAPGPSVAFSAQRIGSVQLDTSSGTAGPLTFSFTGATTGSGRQIVVIINAGAAAGTIGDVTVGDDLTPTQTDYGFAERFSSSIVVAEPATSDADFDVVVAVGANYRSLQVAAYEMFSGQAILDAPTLTTSGIPRTTDLSRAVEDGDLCIAYGGCAANQDITFTGITQVREDLGVSGNYATLAIAEESISTTETRTIEAESDIRNNRFGLLTLRAV